VLNVVRVWILLSTLLVSSGWILSIFHQLNRGGYDVVFGLAAVALFFWYRRTQWRPQQTAAHWLQKFIRRFKRPAPFLFLVLVLMSFLGGLLYLSNNGDSNAYRIPRVLHWLGQEQWHWIYTLDLRMNVVGSNFEWLSAPLILFTGTDRWIFLINIASFLMLPALIFSVFTRLQVSPRAAWWWMWLLPSGWCFILQAGSTVNDSYAAVYALAMVDLALRGCESKRMGDLWLSMLGAALVTGVKQTNIPLALVWVVAAWPGIRLFLARPGTTAFIIAVSLLVSTVSQTALNIANTGNWQGLAHGTKATVWNSGSPPWKVIGNLFSIPLQNLVPPLFPPADAWNRAMQRFLQTPLGTHFAAFERFGYLSSGVSESQAGIGLAICLLTLVSLVCVRSFTPIVPSKETIFSRRFLRWIRLIPWIVLLVFMVGICSFEDARLLAAYYPLLFPLLLAGAGHSMLVRQRWWQCFGLLVMLLAIGMLVISRDRPLFPEQAIIEKLEARYPQSNFFRGIDTIYAAPRAIIGAQNYFNHDIPSSERVVGFATTFGALEPGLWMPFGQRRVERVLPGDTAEELQRRGIHYVLVEDIALEAAGITIEQWMQRYNGSLADQLAFLQDRHRPLAHLYLVVLHSLPEATAIPDSGAAANQKAFLKTQVHQMEVGLETLDNTRLSRCFAILSFLPVDGLR
jgi:hypothetical protein